MARLKFLIGSCCFVGICLFALWQGIRLWPLANEMASSHYYPAEVLLGSAFTVISVLLIFLSGLVLTIGLVRFVRSSDT